MEIVGHVWWRLRVRGLCASCCREVSDGMVVKTDSDRVQRNRKLVFELLAADMPEKT